MMTLNDLAQKMRKIDFAMLSTHTDGHQIAGRPMSNNGEVDYDGDSYYFTWDSSRMVADIKQNHRVSLAFQGATGLLGKPGIMVAVEGDAKLIHNKDAFAEHWTKDLDRWFDKGVDTPGLVLIRVSATRIHYWDGEESGEVDLNSVAGKPKGGSHH